jgi:hypothetical protein
MTTSEIYAEFMSALQDYNVASQQLDHIEVFLGSPVNPMPWSYKPMVQNYVKAYERYNAVVDRMYA